MLSIRKHFLLVNVHRRYTDGHAQTGSVKYRSISSNINHCLLSSKHLHILSVRPVACVWNCTDLQYSLPDYWVHCAHAERGCHTVTTLRLFFARLVTRTSIYWCPRAIPMAQIQCRVTQMRACFHTDAQVLMTGRDSRLTATTETTSQSPRRGRRWIA